MSYLNNWNNMSGVWNNAATSSPASSLYYNGYQQYGNTPSSNSMASANSSGYGSQLASPLNSSVMNQYQYYSNYNENASFNQSSYVPNFNYQPVQQQQPIQQVKATKRSRVESTTTESLMRQIFQEVPAQSDNAVKKRKLNDAQVQPVPVQQCYQAAENDQLDDLDGFDSDGFEYDADLANSNLSIDSRGDKKKRVLTKSQRVAANIRERKRMNIMNESFMKLRQALPITTGRKRRKMSRLDIVVGALEYISYLDSLLESDEPCEINFDAYQNSLYLY